ncbi:cytochrome b/b6 domain-containing protein [Thalassotalea euphylliae]|uniref:cytochrome b/b6 domain-containing protein n=1 Tax=Thalassotalea euphylliae TaxID=1655234 RepID=UPI00363D3629
MRIWDYFTQIYHTSQLILLALLWYTGTEGDFETHFICAYLMLALWITRMIWGVIGSETNQFHKFIKSPVTAFKWLKQPHKPHPGHNPITGYMVIALIISLGIQLFTGLFATDDVFAEGPFIYSVSEDFAEKMDSLHHSNFDILLALIGIHVIAAIIHSWRGDNVIKTMLTGKSDDVNTSQAITFKNSLIPLVIWILLFGLFGYLWLGDAEL